MVAQKPRAASGPLCSSVVAERDARKAAEAAALEPKDDEELLELGGKYVGKKFTTSTIVGIGANNKWARGAFRSAGDILGRKGECVVC